MDYFSEKKKKLLINAKQTNKQKPLYLLLINLHSYGADHLSFLSYTLKNAGGKECSNLLIVWKIKYLGKFVLGMAVISVTLSYI